MNRDKKQENADAAGPGKTKADLSPSQEMPTSHPHSETEQLVEPENALPGTTMEAVPEPLREAARRIGWNSLMPVQAKAIPYLLAGRDLMVQARTGSGKTGAFVLPLLQKIDPRITACQALVLVPTRELAQQVAREAEMLAAGTGLNVAAVYGGVSYGPQIDAFRKGAHIVIGTPGRILDHLIKRSLLLDAMRIIVFDEADRMLSMGFYPDMVEIRSYLPSRRNGYMFSATYPAFVRGLAAQFLECPEFLSLSHGSVHVTNTEHIYYEVPAMEKDRCLLRIIEIENPGSAIIFCNTKDRVNYVTAVLQRFGYDADQLSSDLSQSVREKVLARIRKGQIRFLVSTDLAGRGIDIPTLTHVFLYEFPEDPESYIHRAGRTGRAGAGGTAISLVSFMELADMTRAMRRFNIDMICRPTPTDEEVQRVVSERTIALLEAKLRDRDRLQIERMQRLIPLARDLSESSDELAVMAMLLDDFYQQAMHAIPGLPPIEQTTAKEHTSAPRRNRRGQKRK